MYGKVYKGIVRTTFIIDENGKIEKIYEKVRVDGHVDDILKNL
jgi:peroxiredoxin Q/BCP